MEKEKVIIVVSPTGSLTFRDKFPNVPVTPEEIAEEFYRCQQAGASIAHVHVRNQETGLVSTDLRAYGEVVKRIREKSDIIIQIGGAIGFWPDATTKKMLGASEEQRLALLDIEPKPDVITTQLGSVDFRFPGIDYAPLRNTPDFLRKIITTLRQRKFGIEMEIFDVSFLYNGLRLAEEGLFDKKGPLWFLYVFGYGGQPANPRQIVYVTEEGKRLFPQAKWCVIAPAEQNFPVLAMGVALGCHIVRVGMEDNPFISEDKVAKSNVELVEKAVNIIRAHGREVATVEEAKQILNLPS